MKFILFTVFFFTCAEALSAQGRALILCDGQSPKNCYSWDIGSNISPITPKVITGPILPLNGGTMSGLLRLSGGFGLGAIASLGTNIEMDPDTTGIYGAPQSATDCTFPPAWSATTTYNVGDIAKQGTTTYTSIVNSNLNNVPPNATFWISNCTDDRTRLDWHGMEGDFIRIKGKGPSEIGDYFDITRNTPTGTLPLHQLNFLNDSSFNTLLFVNETNGLTSTNFDYSGEIRFGLNSARGVTVGMSQHTCTPTACDGVIEINNGTIMANGGTADQLRILGLLVNQDNDNSGYLIQSAGGIEMSVADATHNILSKGTANNAFDALNGGVRSQALYFYPNTAPNNPATGNGGFEYVGSGNYQYWNGSAWVAAVLNGSGSGFWTRNTSGFIYPATISPPDKVMIGRTTDDGSNGLLQVSTGPISVQGTCGGGPCGILVNQLNDSSGYIVQVNGGIEMTNTADNILSRGQVVGTQFVPIPSGVVVTTNGLIESRAAGYLNVRSGTTAINFDNNAETATLMEISNNGNVLINRTTDDTSGAKLQVFGAPVSIQGTCGGGPCGLLINQLNDGSGYSQQINGGIEITGTTHNLLVKDCTASNCLNVQTGGGYINAGLNVGSVGYYSAGTQVINASGQFVSPAGVLTSGSVTANGAIGTNTGFDLGANTVISSANGGQFVGPGGVHTNGTIVASGVTGSNFIQAGTDGFYVGTNQSVDNGGGVGPRFVGVGGVFTNGPGTFNGAVGSNVGFNVGSNPGIPAGTTRVLTMTAGCTITISGGVVIASTC